MHEATGKSIYIYELEEHGTPHEVVEVERKILHHELKHAAVDLWDALVISCIYLMFPLDIIIRKFYLKNTNRPAQSLSAMIVFDLALFIVVIILINDYYRFQKYDTENRWQEEDYGHMENLMINIIWYRHCSSTQNDVLICAKSTKYHFDWLLTVMVFLVWMKMLLYFRVNKEFGPLLKMVELMSEELTKFTVIWFQIIIVFVSTGVILFGGLPLFHSIFDTFVFFFEASLGEWDGEVYHEPNEEGEVNKSLETIGVLYHMLFLLINLVLMLNLVIAILSNTYKSYSQISNGLYFNVLIDKFA